MDPRTEHPRTHVDIDEPHPDGGLVELVDQALVRLDGLRDRPRLSSAVTMLLVFALALGWGLTRWRAVEPFDDRIPRVDEMVTTDQSPADPAGNGGGGAAAPDARQPGATVASPASTSAAGAVESEADADVRIVVHVSGAVETEGLVELSPGSRLADAIAAAGGGTATADVHRLNLATPLIDGMHIRVPELGEEGADAARPLVETAPTGSAAGGTDGAPGSGGGPVNVNQADLVELQRLPGIGPAIAAAIVAWRDDNGPFESVDDLLDVPGIGPAKLAAIEDQVVL